MLRDLFHLIWIFVGIQVIFILGVSITIAISIYVEFGSLMEMLGL